MTAAAILSVLDRMDVRRRALLDRVRAVAPAVRARRPAPDAWSALEIVEHLVRAERVVLNGLGGDGAPGVAPRTWKSRVAYWMVVGVLRSPWAVRAPSRSMLPTGGRSLEELEADWNALHRDLRAWVGACSPAELGRAVFRHPVSGPLTPAQAVRMLDVHLRRHEGQVARILDATA